MRFLLYNIRYGTGKYLNQPMKYLRGYLGQVFRSYSPYRRVYKGTEGRYCRTCRSRFRVIQDKGDKSGKTAWGVDWKTLCVTI